MLPLFPWAARSIRIDEQTDFVLCSDAAVIKGAPVPQKAKLVCYCHSPPRYLWDLQQEYAERASNLGLVGRTVFRLVAPRVREFDRLAAQRVDVFVANSRFVAERIKRCYGKESAVVHPFVDLENFTPAASDARGNFYLIVSQLVPYKRVDLAIDAFNKSGKRLLIIGEGPEREALQQRAGRTIEFLGAQSVNVLREHYQRCRALIFPGVEDFGITPLEAMASGRPVIAYSKGGVSESVLARQTGLFFHDQTAQALASAVEEFEGRDWSPSVCRDRAEQFSRRRFRDEMLCVLERSSRST
jgi:glycosyltransferase involved in cell wall biosynthesis